MFGQGQNPNCPLGRAQDGIHFSEHLDDDGVLIKHACHEGFDMRLSFCRFRKSDPADGNRWSYRVAVLAVSVGLFALVAAVIIERSHRHAVAAPAADRAGVYSGGGNLVPVF